MAGSFNAVVLAGTAYSDAATIQDVWGAAGGAFNITGGSVFYSLQYPAPLLGANQGGFGTPQWTDDAQLTAGTGQIPPRVTGIKFRNVSASSPATVSAVIASPNQPVLALSSAGAVAVSGSNVNVQHNNALVAAEPTIDFIDAGANILTVADDAANTRVVVTMPRVLTGIVAGTGAITAGTGFTVVRNSAGNYTVTITVAYSAAPTVSAVVSDGVLGAGLTIGTVVAGSFVVHTFDTSTTLVGDHAFHFTTWPTA